MYKEVIERMKENDVFKSQIEPFQKSAELFRGLTHKQQIRTNNCEVINILISNDSNHAIVIGHEYR
jgi:hypothetical protein